MACQMSYEEAMAYIGSFPRFSPAAVQAGDASFNLDSIRELVRRLGNPEQKLRFVHVAGTNGKGSVCAFLASILLESGYRTGLYTSPYIERFTERIQLGEGRKPGQEPPGTARQGAAGEDEPGSGSGTGSGRLREISREDLARLLSSVREAAEGMKAEGLQAPSEFEVVTALAFLYFLEKRCEIVVLETGLGGRLDATNVIGCPELAILTAIGYDHTEILGATLPEIAFEKAGIIKRGGRVLACPQGEEVLRVFAEVCRARGADFYRASLPAAPSRFSLEGQDFPWPGFPRSDALDARELAQGAVSGQAQEGQAGIFRHAATDLTTCLLGKYQIQNAALAVSAAMLLREAGFRIGEGAVRRGVAAARWKGRFELLRCDPLVLSDGSHNPEGVEALCASLEQYFPGQKLLFVTGVLADKDYRRMMRLAAGRAAAFYTTAPLSPRALPAEALAETVRDLGLGIQAEAYGSIREAVEAALRDFQLQRQQALPGDPAAPGGGTACPAPAAIVCFGSLYMIGEIRRLCLGER